MILNSFIPIGQLDTSSPEYAALARKIDLLRYLALSRDELEDARWVSIGASFVVSHNTSTDEVGTLVYLMTMDLGLQVLPWPATLVGGVDACIDLNTATLDEVRDWGGRVLDMFEQVLPWAYRLRTLQLIHHAASTASECPYSLFGEETDDADDFQPLWRLKTTTAGSSEWCPLSAAAFHRCMQWYQQSTEPVLRKLATKVVKSVSKSDAVERGASISMRISGLGKVVVQEVALYHSDDGHALDFYLKASFDGCGIPFIRLVATLPWKDVEAATGVSLALYEVASQMYPRRPAGLLLRMCRADAACLQHGTDGIRLNGLLESVEIP